MILLPRVGQVVRLSLPDTTELADKRVFKSRIADVQGEVAAIELPIDEKTGKGDSFVVGVEYEAWYTGEDGSRYDFRTVVLGKRNENIPLLLILIPDKSLVKRTQRRNYLRVKSMVEIAVKVLEESRNYHFLARTLDISGGGVSFLCPEELQINVEDKVSLWICLPSKTGSIQHAFARGVVTRCQPPKHPGAHQLISVKFIEVNESDQTKIVRACYERQLEKR